MTTIGWGARLREARGANSQVVWCAKIVISRSIWGDYEKEIRSPNLDLLLRVAAHSGRSVHWIATGEDPPQSTNYDILVGCIQAVQEQVPTIDAESKAKLTLVLYKDRMANLKKEETGNAVNRRSVS